MTLSEPSKQPNHPTQELRSAILAGVAKQQLTLVYFRMAIITAGAVGHLAISLGASLGAEGFSIACGKNINNWARWWTNKQKEVGVKAFRNAVAQAKYLSAGDYLENATRSADGSEDQKRNLQKAEECLVEARNDLLPWTDDPVLRDSLIHCHHLLICVTYWNASEMGKDPGTGIRRAFLYFEKLLEIIAGLEAKAVEDHDRAKQSWVPALGEWRAQAALESVAGVYDQNIPAYVEKLEALAERQLLHSIAWRNNKATGHVVECLPSWMAPSGAGVAAGIDGSQAAGMITDGTAALVGDSSGAGMTAAAVAIEDGRQVSLEKLEERHERLAKNLAFFQAQGIPTGQIEAEMAGLAGQILLRSSSPRQKQAALAAVSAMVEPEPELERAPEPEPEVVQVPSAPPPGTLAATVVTVTGGGVTAHEDRPAAGVDMQYNQQLEEALRLSMLSPTQQQAPLGMPPAATAPVPLQSPQVRWEWGPAHTDRDPSKWTGYSAAVTSALEAAYSAGQRTVELPPALAGVPDGLVVDLSTEHWSQYRTTTPGRVRPVRRQPAS